MKALLAPLLTATHHHWRATRRSSRRRIPIYTCHWDWWAALLWEWHWLTGRIHHLRSWCHQIWRSEVWSSLWAGHHDWATHVSWLLWDERLSSARVRSELLSHLRTTLWHVVHDWLHSLLKCHLSWLAHGWRWVGHWNLLKARRGEGLSRKRWHHPVVIVVGIKLLTHVAVVVHVHTWLSR